MKDVIKNIVMVTLKFILYPLKLFPIKKYIMFCTNSGQSFSCNPKYIYLYLHEDKRFKNFTFVWTFKSPNLYENKLLDNTIICKYRSLRYYYYKIVSSVYIANSIEGNECPKKNNQIRIQTWHGGGCYKKVAMAEKERNKAYKLRTKINMKNTTAFISSSKLYSEEVITNNFEYKSKILEIGMPRNDILFNIDKHHEINEKIRKLYSIPKNNLIVLYAPTWRYDESKIIELDYQQLKKSLQKKYNKEITFLYRAHLHMKKEYQDIISVSNYEDMQELLIASDILISDYSSSIWDFSILKKPCFLYCPDLDYYIEHRGFVKNIYEWGFPIAKNNNELSKNIENFDIEDYKKKMENHQKLLGTYENGTACKNVADYLENQLMLKNR